jgi:tetratricopeptide (TPR) repeat protein
MLTDTIECQYPDGVSIVADSPSRKTLGLNQHTFQRLKLALSLHLRRQIFVAVCDDLTLRDRMVAQLLTTLSSSIDAPDVSEWKRYPRLVSLQLNISDPDPIRQITQWLTECPPPRQGNRRVAIPVFQFLGIEHLTRQPAAVQRLFFAHLETMERSPVLESGVLLWLPQPWFRALSQSAPEFWRRRTGTFEFVGDPTPTAAERPEVPPVFSFQLPTQTTPAPAVPVDSSLPSQQTAAVDEQPQAPKDQPVPLNTSAISTDEVDVEEPTVVSPAATEPAIAESLPLKLVRRVALLHQQQAPAETLAEAYRELGNYYRDRIDQGEISADNLSIAIHSYKQTLELLPDTPLSTDVLNDLGNLYWNLSRFIGNAEESQRNLQTAIQAYQLALAKLDGATQPQVYTTLQNNLGAAFTDLARYENPAINLQRSIQAYRQSLQYRTVEFEPQRYASTQNNLGTTYWNLAQLQEPVTNLKRAIASYVEALQHYNAPEEPLSYGMIHNNLGTAYWNLAQHENPRESLLRAIAAYQRALHYRTLEQAPAAFAATQNNLGTAFWHLADHFKSQPEQRLSNLQQAINAYEAAVLAAEALQRNAQQLSLNFDASATRNNLGLAHFLVGTDAQLPMDGAERSAHLQAAIVHQVRALEAWQDQPDLRKTTFNTLVQTIRTLYDIGGLTAQNAALSQIPGDLLAEVLAQL